VTLLSLRFAFGAQDRGVFYELAERYQVSTKLRWGQTWEALLNGYFNRNKLAEPTDFLLRVMPWFTAIFSGASLIFIPPRVNDNCTVAYFFLQDLQLYTQGQLP
jgi:hypothetical protein